LAESSSVTLLPVFLPSPAEAVMPSPLTSPSPLPGSCIYDKYGSVSRRRLWERTYVFHGDSLFSRSGVVLVTDGRTSLNLRGTGLILLSIISIVVPRESRRR